MANFVLTKDKFGAPIQTLSPSTNINSSINGTSQLLALPSGTEVVRIAPTADCYIKFGDGSVVATTSDMNMLTGVEMFRVPDGATHLAVIQNGAVTGVLSVTKMV